MERVIIDGIPTPKGRPRYFSRNGRVVVYTPEKTKAAERRIRVAFNLEYMMLQPLDYPLHVHLHFVMPIPKSISKVKRAKMIGAPHHKRPDLDNLSKTVLDALNGALYGDDGIVSKLSASKVYGEHPQTIIEWCRALED